MPELPEVETLRRTLEPLLLGRSFTAAALHRRSVLILPGDPPGGFSRARKSARPRPVQPQHLLCTATITRLDRRGKQLAIIAADGRALIVHLGMTGQVLWRSQSDSPRDPHIHITWKLGNDSELVFRDPRRFGGVWFIPDPAAHTQAWSRLGPDALDISGPDLHNRLADSRRPIKAALLDQAVLAGVGNIYADESLFLARINPRRLARRISPEEFHSLAAAIRKTLRSAVKARGSTLRDYRDANGESGEAQLKHRVYGRAGKPCLTCGKPLSSAICGQRTTVFCRACQK